MSGASPLSVALALNTLALPGLGTLLLGKITNGVIQLALFLVAIPLTLVFIGLPIGLGMWVWAIIDGAFGLAAALRERDRLAATVRSGKAPT